MSKFGQLLRNARKEKQISQRDLAKQVGVDFSYISKIENGVLEPPSEEVIQSMARALELDADELFLTAKKIPPRYRDIILQDELIREFMSKYSTLTNKQKALINNILQEAV